MGILALPDTIKRSAGAFLDDVPHNGAVNREEPHILVVRHLADQNQYNNHYLGWLRANHPRVARHIRLARLLPIGPSLRNVALLVPWFQDPMRERMRSAFRAASRLEARCRRRRVPVVNPVAMLSVAIRSRAYAAISGAGARAPGLVRLDDRAAWDTLLERIAPPFIVREDQIHGGPMELVARPEDLRSIRPGAFRDPVAVEYVDTRGSDGLWRKQRYVLFGSHGVPRHLVVSRSWIAREENRADLPEARAEELAFLRDTNPYHDLFDRIRKILGLDAVAFDYAIDSNGQIVVWSIHPTPVHCTSVDEGPGHAYLIPTINRLYATLTRFLIEQARIDETV